jgi:hypothetical protein
MSKIRNLSLEEATEIRGLTAEEIELIAGGEVRDSHDRCANIIFYEAYYPQGVRTDAAR